MCAILCIYFIACCTVYFHVVEITVFNDVFIYIWIFKIRLAAYCPQ